MVRGWIPDLIASPVRKAPVEEWSMALARFMASVSCFLLIRGMDNITCIIIYLPVILSRRMSYVKRKP